MPPDLEWINGFVRSIRDYVYVRERDSLLILVPNQAYKLNRTAVVLLKGALNGDRIQQILESKFDGLSTDVDALRDVHDFFCDVRALVMGCLREGRGRRAVEGSPFVRPYSELPVLSEIAVTYRCNLSCRFCYAGCHRAGPNLFAAPIERKRGSVLSPREMSTVEVKRVLSVIRYDAEVPSVSWTGGEPLLRDDIVDLTRYAHQIGLRVNLITNGTLLDADLVRRLQRAGLNSAQVSLEGPNAEVHDGLTQVPGSFDRTLHAVELLRDAGLHVHTNTTVNRVNARRLVGPDGVVRLVKRLGLPRFSMNMVLPCGNAGKERVTVTYTEIAGIIEEIKSDARADGLEFLWYSPTPYCIYNPVAAGLGAKSCSACEGLLSVAPNGDVYPCSSLPIPVGNLLQRPFEAVWNSRKARWWRNKRYAKSICRKCERFTVCAGACPIYWESVGYAEILHSNSRCQTRLARYDRHFELLPLIEEERRA